MLLSNILLRDLFLCYSTHSHQGNLYSHPPQAQLPQNPHFRRSSKQKFLSVQKYSKLEEGYYILFKIKSVLSSQPPQLL